MTRFVISDLHLCDKGPRDNFAFRGEARFHRFLDYVREEVGRLYVIGDLFDWWQCNLSRSVCAYKDLTSRLTYAGDIGAIWVTGNHDNALNDFLAMGITNLAGSAVPRMVRPFEETIGGRRFAFLHGHEADNYCSDVNPGIGEITAIISALLEDKNKCPVRHGHLVEDSFISALEAPLNLWRHLTLQADRRGEMLDNVEKYRKEKQADVVVSGHTHEPGRIGDYHYNCGCWCRDCDTFVRIEDSGAVQILAWDGTQAVPFEKELR